MIWHLQPRPVLIPGLGGTVGIGFTASMTGYYAGSKKKEEKEKKTRKETIRKHWWKYRHPRDPYEKNDMRKQIRRMIRDYRKYFGKR